MDIDLRVFLARSKLRVLILKKLEKELQIASFLARDLHKHREVISRIFLDLKKYDLVKCMNPKAPNFRSYTLTKKGKTILKKY